MTDSASLSPLILVENERTAGGRYDHWQDSTGERYQYPNQYKNKIIPGRRFIYYRGSRRADATRATPEYFGFGVIGAVELDPSTDPFSKKSSWKWICEIEDYSAFPKAVPFKVDGEAFENIAQNLWSVAVREISEDTYLAIVAAAGLSPLVEGPLSGRETLSFRPEVAAEPLLHARTWSSSPLTPVVERGTGSRRSRFAARIGRRGEEAALEFFRNYLDPAEAGTLRWVSDDGETPGWDIEYRTSAGDLVVVEVKATSGVRFPAVELTANEWRAAIAHGPRFTLCLVASALDENPKVQIVKDPASLVANGQFAVTTALWRLEARAVVEP